MQFRKIIYPKLIFVNKLINDIPNIYIDFKESKETNKFEVHLNGVSVEKHIRSLSVSNLVSKVATIGKVRKQMVKIQHFFRIK
jgi:cytidylate kinase